jgi:GAF domain-containing protein
MRPPGRGKDSAAGDDGDLMSEREPLVRSLAEFARAMSHSYDVDDALARLGDALVEAVEVAGVGISVTDPDGILRYTTATNEAVAEIERVQEDAQRGPCYEAFRIHRPVLLNDIDDRPDWAEFRDAARRLGLRSAAGVPMSAGREVFGAVNLYETKLRTWTPEDIEVTSLFADMAAGYLLHKAFEASRALAEQLQSALDTRVVIEQAKGVLASEWGVAVDEAFQHLRAEVRRRGMTLHDAAAAVVDGSFRPPAPAGRTGGASAATAPDPAPPAPRPASS